LEKLTLRFLVLTVLHCVEEFSVERNLDHMQASLGSRDELTVKVQHALSLLTKKEAAHVIDAVIGALETTLLNNLSTDGFTLKLKTSRYTATFAAATSGFSRQF
jgi:hypothetical protein